MTTRNALILAFTVTFGSVACGSSAMPAERLTNTKSAIRAAEEVEAGNTPRAALHLKLANDQLATAERLIEDGEGERADLYLNQAQADAELALALARATHERGEAQRAQARIQDLRQKSQ